MLTGDLTAAQAAFAGGRANVNLRQPFPQADGALLPVHCAAASASLSTLRWLAEELHCPVRGPQACLHPRSRPRLHPRPYQHPRACSLQPPIRPCPAVYHPQALSFGRPRKSVLRIGIEHAATDVLQWLTCADDAPPHVGLPLPMPPDSGAAVAVPTLTLTLALTLTTDPNPNPNPDPIQARRWRF